MPRSARYRAPTKSGQKLVVPPWGELGDLLSANIEWRRRHDFDVLGRPLSELVGDARREVLARSTDDGDASLPDKLSDANASPGICPFIVTGHQPGLPHPGVWVKNFAAAALASAHGGIGLHVVIDADVCRAPATAVPTGTVEAPRLASIEFDHPTEPCPWEERRILDEKLWLSFAERVRDACTHLLPDRFLDSWWPAVVDAGWKTDLVGASLAQARRQSELQWGTRNAELPQSLLCQTAAFRWFACAVFAELPRFAAAYNGVLAEYRRAHGLRNHAHPVPDLSSHGPWLEAPFWIWTAADPQRRPVYARSVAGGLLVSDRRDLERLVPLSGPRDAAGAVSALQEWEAAGVKLRSRALATTLFTRLAVADLFLHGIGGAKYDEATDAISERFFGAPPPGFATVSGTLRLPISHSPGSRGDVVRLRNQLRELEYHPERRLALSSRNNGERSAGEALTAEKSRWIQTPKRPETAAQRHRAIAAANNALQSLVAGDRLILEQQLATAVDRSRANRILDSREYAFCLFPQKMLVQFLLDFRAEAL